MTTDLNLAPGEGLLYQLFEVTHNSKDVELYLTNQNVIYVEDEWGFFKSGKKVNKIPLRSIKVVDGVAQASVYKNEEDDLWVLRLILNTSTEEFSKESHIFTDRKVKGEMDTWALEIAKMLNATAEIEEEHDNAVATTIKNVFDFLGSGQLPKSSPKKESVTSKCIGCMAPLSGYKGTVAVCKYCDTKQTL